LTLKKDAFNITFAAPNFQMILSEEEEK